jgi:hypothetical protein
MQVNLNSLASAFRKIAHSEKLADATYKTVLDRYPKVMTGWEGRRTHR